MYALIIMLGIAAGILVIAEILHKKKLLKGELGRKFVHICGGMVVAVSPFFVSYRVIEIVSIAAVLFIAFGRYGGLIKSVYDVERRSWGDILGPATIAALASFQPNEWIFCAAILHLALADGFAAVIGTSYGKSTRYKVFGQTKSIVGTVTFYLISLLITTIVVSFDPNTYTSPLLIVLLLPPGATLLENIGVYGADNVLVTIYVAAFLSYFQVLA